MAKKFSSFLDFSKKCALFVWALVCLAGLSVWNVLLVLTSPLWYTIWLLCNPEDAAHYLVCEKGYHSNEAIHEFTYSSAHDFFVCKVMYTLWCPILCVIPMSAGKYFIDCGTKPLCRYSTSTQVKYFLSLSEKEKIDILRSNRLSARAKKEIWNLPSKNKFRRMRLNHDERKYFFLAEVPLTTRLFEQFATYDMNAKLLRTYFSKRTPNTETIKLFLRLYRAGLCGLEGEEMVLDILRKQRPTPEVINLYMTSGCDDLKEKAQAIADGYLDIDAIQQTLGDIIYADENEKKKILERWRNYCAGREVIVAEAQKKLTFELYEILTEQGCHLSPKGICALCARFKEQDEEFLHSVLKNEFQLINEEVMTVLKGEYWKYSVYLEVKKELKK